MFKVKRRRAACVKVARVGDDFMLKLLFEAWLEDYKESRRAKRWFNREAGADAAGEEEPEWCWEGGEDPISLLPRDVSVKVL